MAENPPLSPVGRAIVVHLRANLTRGPLAPRDIARGTGLKAGTVRKELLRLKRKGAVLESSRGYYHAFMDSADLARFRAPLPLIHHIPMEIVLPRKGVTLPRQAGAMQATLDPQNGAPGPWRFVEENRGWHRKVWFEGRPGEVSVYPSAMKAIVQLECSEAGLDGPTWIRYLAWLRGIFLGWFEVDLDACEVRIHNPEFNVDMHGLRIQGATSLSLRRFSDAYLRAYNKADRLRFEVATLRSVSVEEVTRILEQFYERSRRPEPVRLTDPLGPEVA